MTAFGIRAWCICVVGVTTFVGSAKAVQFAAGTGEPNDPYRIATSEQFVSIGADPDLLNKHFVLVDDIDLDPNLPGGQVFTQAVIPSFQGCFDGNDHNIDGLTIRNDHADYLGLFSQLINGRICRVTLTNVSVVGRSKCGGIVGSNSGHIERSRVTGKIIGKSGYAGGGGGRKPG